MAEIPLYFYLTVLFVVFVVVRGAIQGHKRRKAAPPTRRERWLGAQSSLGAALVALSMIIGGVPLIFAIMYLHSSDTSANSHRDSVIVITVVTSIFVVGAALNMSAQRKLRQLRSQPQPKSRAIA